MSVLGIELNVGQMFLVLLCLYMLVRASLRLGRHIDRQITASTERSTTLHVRLNPFHLVSFALLVTCAGLFTLDFALAGGQRFLQNALGTVCASVLLYWCLKMLSRNYVVTWDGHFVEGPTAISSWSFDRQRAKIAIGDVTSYGKLRWGKHSIADKDGNRIVWSEAHLGHTRFLMEMRAARPDVDWPPDGLD